MKGKHQNPFQEIIQLSSKAGKYCYQELMWSAYFLGLPKPKVKYHLEPKTEDIAVDLEKAGFTLLNYEINEKEFSNYLNQAQYSNFPNYYGGGTSKDFIRKAVQHFFRSATFEAILQ